ncbi:hypothetical protein B4168_2756 [Anoxybacillus flavithermus]|nr:hypothetical protein B4168_2756 [Anoxybacillus flavithermus]OAO87523.1 hypothetical protein GT23_1172 [Parageobacillus thermoglucosidasius]
MLHPCSLIIRVWIGKFLFPTKNCAKAAKRQAVFVFILHLPSFVAYKGTLFL